MGDQQYQNDKEPEQQKNRQAETQRDSQNQGHQPESGHAAYSATTTVSQPSQAKSTTLKIGELKRTANRAGETNITLEMVPVPVGHAVPVYFNLGTLPENELEVILEQLSYRKVHNGQGKVTTQLIPIEPIGTKGRIVVRDLTTGEIVEMPWMWRRA